VGKPGDNAWSESFFANLKKESVHWAHFATREEARQAMFAYIEAFYNTTRIQKRLGYLSPLEWLGIWEQGKENMAA
jgi:putative transposase